MLLLLPSGFYSSPNSSQHLVDHSYIPCKVAEIDPGLELWHQSGLGKFCQRRFGLLNRFPKQDLWLKSTLQSIHQRILHQKHLQSKYLLENYNVVSESFYNRSDRVKEVFLCREYLHFWHHNFDTLLWLPKNLTLWANHSLAKSYLSSQLMLKMLRKMLRGGKLL